MRILILGGAGMLGHKLAQRFDSRLDTWVTVRDANDFAHYGLVPANRIIGGVDAFVTDTVVRAIAAVHPEAVINCIGTIKQLPAAKDPLTAIEGNSLFPHRLAAICRAAGARLVHISTDCVFSGRRGGYKETDSSDAEDLYGRSKFLGEVEGEGILTLRTSIIGRQLRSTTGLVEWFLSHRGGRVQGYRRAIYTGLTTIAFADLITNVLKLQKTLAGLYQVASEAISKYELLCLMRDAYRVDTVVEPSDEVSIDRSLDSTRFRTATGLAIPGWPEMVREMAADPTPYDQWRSQRVP